MSAIFVICHATKFSAYGINRKRITEAKYWDRTGCWGFIVKDKGLYGTYIFQTYEENGKLYIEGKQLIPYEYTFIKLDDNYKDKGIVRCTKRGGAIDLRAWTGKMVE